MLGNFIMLVGLPASGKSTLSHLLGEEGEVVVVLSSDSIREELYGGEEVQGDPKEVFKIMFERTIENLNNGVNVIYDATNISYKKRRHLLTQLPKGAKKTVVYTHAEYKTILERNQNRERVVPVSVIERMYKNLQLPIYEEGWDKIVHFVEDRYEYPKQFTDAIRAEVLFNRGGYDLMTFLAEHFEEFFGVYDMPQDSKYHSFSVSRHIYHVYRYVLENYEGEDKELMLWTALLHDVGKHFCKSFKNRKGEETRYANFISHDYVGSQMAIGFLNDLGFDDDFIYKASTLIRFHMYLLDENASKKKLIDKVGEDMYKKLEFLRDADTLSH